MIKKVAVGGAAPASGITFFETELTLPSTLTTSEYTVTPGSLFPITSITITKRDGVDVTITAVSAATDEPTLAAILKTEVMKLGYNFTEGFGIKTELPSVKISGQKLTIISELTFKSINSAGSVSFTKKSTQSGKCTFIKETASTTNPTVITVNGTARSDAHAWTYGTTATATVKGYIDTALATEISAGTIISTAVSDTGTKYKITIEAVTGTTILLNGVSFAQSDCKPYFTT